MKFSYDESYLPLKKNLTGTLAAQDSAGEGDAEHQPGDDTRREEPLRSYANRHIAQNNKRPHISMRSFAV